MAAPQRFLILPARGLQASAANSSSSSRDFLASMTVKKSVSEIRGRLRRTAAAGATAAARAAGRKLPKVVPQAFEILASLNEDGVKLVSATPEMISALRFEQPGLRIVPEYRYRTANSRIELRSKAKKAAGTSAATQRKLSVKVTRADTGAAVPGVGIVAFTDFANGVGVGATTKTSGKVTLKVSGSTKYERFYAQHDL